MKTGNKPNLGGIGESTFATLANEAGIVFNKSDIDKTGWDYLVEVPVSRRVPELDKRESPEIKCLVQVKATATGSAPDVKLSHWERFAKSPLPAFFVIFEIGSDNKAKTAYVVHVGREWIERVLERLSKVPTKSAHKIHKQTMQATWDAAKHRLASLTGDALVASIVSHVGTDYYKYLQNKIGIIGGVGYSDRPYRITVTLPKGASHNEHELLANFAIGQQQNLTVASYQVHETRFGVERRVRTGKGSEKMEISFAKPPSVGTTSVEVSDALGTDLIALNCETYLASAVFPFLPPEYHKAAFVSDIASLIVSPRRQGDGIGAVLTWRLNCLYPDRKMKLSESVCASRLASILRQVGHGGIRIAFDRDEKRSEFLISQASEDVDAELFRLTELIECMGRIVPFYGLPANIEFEQGELLAQHDRIKLLDSIARQDGTEVAIDCRMLRLEEPKMDVEHAAILWDPYIDVGGYLLVVAVALPGRPEWRTVGNDVWIAVKTSSPRVVTKRIVQTRNRAALRAKVLHEDARRILEAEGLPFVVTPHFE
jgi:hypothetical protein